MLIRFIAPKWFETKDPSPPRVVEGDFNPEKITELNNKGYNVYYFPNDVKDYESIKEPNTFVTGIHIDNFNWVYIDFDCKSDPTVSKDIFLNKLLEFELIPTKIIDSGNGIHAYWKVSDLDAKSYLRLCRRLIRKFNTDEAVGKILQLMRLEGTINTKIEENPVPCEIIWSSENIYTCEELSKALPSITIEDEKFCETHYNTTYKVDDITYKIDDKMPSKFGELLTENPEVKKLWVNITDDRSKNDYRLGHIMFGNDFTRDEAATVLANSAKALARAPIYRLTYAHSIISKIWTYEKEPNKQLVLSASVEDILRKAGDTIKGTPFRCHPRIDNTDYGFRLGHVIGLVAGSGVGKTAFALNMYKWFSEANPEYHHFFVPLEQPAHEIALRWQTMCGTNTNLHKKVHVISNYNDDGSFRHLSLAQIKDYIVKWQEQTGNKVGCVVIDHIGALKKSTKDGENQGVVDICHEMKAFAIQTNTLLVMQSQTSREKAGIGDLELNKDAAYGTVFFESYCDYLVTIWQPLKRCHAIEGCPLVTAFKFCKIRHKKPKKDVIKEDVPYYFAFDSETELMQDMTQDQEVSFNFFIKQATNKRKADRKTELIDYKSVPYHEGENGKGTTDSNKSSIRH